MDLGKLVKALMNYDVLSARQWVTDAIRGNIRWSEVACPTNLSVKELTVAAGVAELLALRMGQFPPAWTKNVTESPETIWLVRSAYTMPRLRRLCEQESPEPLRKRGILAPPEFLTVA